MSEVVSLVLDPDPACRAREAGLFLAQLEDLCGKLAKTLEGATPEELAWQIQPGANTIAMLATHVAIAQVHLTDVGVRRLPENEVAAVLGLDSDADGMPLAAGKPPPPSLAGRTAADLVGLLERARRHAARHVAQLGEEDLDRRFERNPPGAAKRVLNVRWVLHHMQEHVGGHLAQAQFLRAAYRQRS